MPKRTSYIATLLYGSLAAMNETEIEKNLAESTQAVLESNRMKAAAEKITFGDGSSNHIKHVIYIIKENRTYDQILGDLAQNGKPVGNGDTSLTMFGEAVTPTCTSWHCSLACSTTSTIREKFRVTGTCGRMRQSARTTWRRRGSRPIEAESVRTILRRWAYDDTQPR